MGELRIIVRRYCDEQMARSKGYLGNCNKDCRRCICCIEIDQIGNKEHVNIKEKNNGKN